MAFDSIRQRLGAIIGGFDAAQSHRRLRWLLQIAAALGIPYPYLTGDAARGNFSNTRVTLLDFRRRVSAIQHNVIVHQLCPPSGSAGWIWRYSPNPST